MTKLSVNINKVATIRNARGGNRPDILKVALDCESFGADGITVHPRPDERHIRYADLDILRPQLKTEFNIEGNPSPKFIEKVLQIRPTQVTLVPDAPDAITSNAGWDTKENVEFLTEIVNRFKEAGIRTSIFVDADPDDRLIRVIQRDVIERGRTAEAVMERYEKVLKPMHLEFIEPAKRIADLIVPQGGHNRKAIEILKMYIEKIVGR